MRAKDRTPHLSDDEARALFHALMHPEAGDPRQGGFLASLRAACEATDTPLLPCGELVFVPSEFERLLLAVGRGEPGDPAVGRWWRPRPEHRLPLDDEIEKLLRRRDSPRIDPDASERPYSRHGPFQLARLGLSDACKYPLNPERQREAARAADRRLETIHAALEVVREIHALCNGDPEWLATEHELPRLLNPQGLRTYLGVTTDDRLRLTALDLGGAVLTLRRLRSFLAEKREVHSRFGDAHGNRDFWQGLFLADIGRVWGSLTGEAPGRGVRGPFADFVSAAWHSLGDDMPAVSFDRALRASSRP